jgi:hypothetical protein
LPIWRIFPVARDNEDAWLDYGRWTEVLVRAATAARARVVAAAELQDRSGPIGNESAAGYAALEDPKLYHVVRVDGGTRWCAEDRRRERVLKAESTDARNGR